jgi:uncharacterized protein
MQWTPGGLSDDLEDRRNESGGGGGGGFGGGRLGIGGILIVGLLSLIFRHNFFTLFSGDAGAPAAARSAPHRQPTGQQDTEAQFMSFVLDDAQRNWDRILPRDAGVRYRHAKLVLFRDAYPSGCGMAQDATGPFYCPEDEKVYLDLGFFNELRTRFGASNGEFAQAYVVAHEIGHHVQKVLGIEPKVHALQERRPGQANRLSVALELQADCFAGIWGNSTAQRRLIDTADIQSALSAAAAVCDDRIQRMSTGQVSPEKFTHGSAAQRTAWFQRGLNSGKIAACDTFGQR